MNAGRIWVHVYYTVQCDSQYVTVEHTQTYARTDKLASCLCRFCAMLVGSKLFIAFWLQHNFYRDKFLTSVKNIGNGFYTH